MNYCNRWRALINSRNVSQLSVADKLGITRSRLNNYLAGRTEPDQIMLSKMAAYFDVSIDYLLGRTDNERVMLHGAAIAPEVFLSSYKRHFNDELVKWIPIYHSRPIIYRDEHKKITPIAWMKAKNEDVSSGRFKSHYALYITDDSMSPELTNGDVVYIRPPEVSELTSFKFETIYAVRLSRSDKQGLSLKRCLNANDATVCMSDNKKYEPITITEGEDISKLISGVVCGVWRYLISNRVIQSLKAKKK